MYSAYNNKSTNIKDYTKPESSEWKFGFTDNLELSKNKVSIGIIPLKENLKDGKIICNEEQKIKGEDELLSELDMEYLKHVTAGEVKEIV